MSEPFLIAEDPQTGDNPSETQKWDVDNGKHPCADVEIGPEHAQDLNDAEGEVPPKKRKTRRGKSKSKRRSGPPFQNKNDRYRKTPKVIKPEAPHNSNQFLIEDHGSLEELAANLKNSDQVSTSTLTRTRDSSFSVDSDGEFCSPSDEEEQYFIKDFDDQYRIMHAERLQQMSREALIKELLGLENKVDTLAKRLRKTRNNELDQVQEVESSVVVPIFRDKGEQQQEIERLIIENENLRRENDLLRSKYARNDRSSSQDSETDSSESCSSSSNSTSSSSSCNDRKRSVSKSPVTGLLKVNSVEVNGHSPSNLNAA